jgi:gliding motility-associated-like protein
MRTLLHLYLVGALLLLSAFQATAQVCPDLIYPIDGETDIPVDTSISWENPGAVSGFIISIGTSPGGVDILQNRTSSPITSYTPETGLPEDTWIYVSIRLERADGSVINCPGQRFRTAPFDAPPGCTSLIEPVNGSEGFPVNEAITWAYAPTATGYRISIGSSPGGTDITNDLDVGNQLSFNPPGSLDTNTEIFVRITPYNRLGDALSLCEEERFTTGQSSVDCGPQRPSVSSLPEVVGLCPEDNATELASDALADGYNWYRVEMDGTERLIGTGSTLEVNQTGAYLLEAYNLVGSVNEFTVCSSFREYEVILSEPPIIRAIQVQRNGGQLRLEVQMASQGNYEYSLQPDTGFQDSPIFSGLPIQPYTVYVRGRQGCGFTQQEVNRELGPADFPPFFTPNSDGFNDRWKFQAPKDLSDADMERIRIFDRYGNFLIQLDRNTEGWDGNVRGKPVPSSVYWFEAVSVSQQIIRGYFALKR